MDNFSIRQPKLLNAGFHHFICFATSAKIWITLASAAEDLTTSLAKITVKPK